MKKKKRKKEEIELTTLYSAIPLKCLKRIFSNGGKIKTNCLKRNPIPVTQSLPNHLFTSLLLLHLLKICWL